MIKGLPTPFITMPIIAVAICAALWNLFPHVTMQTIEKGVSAMLSKAITADSMKFTVSKSFKPNQEVVRSICSRKNT